MTRSRNENAAGLSARKRLFGGRPLGLDGDNVMQGAPGLTSPRTVWDRPRAFFKKGARAVRRTAWHECCGCNRMVLSEPAAFDPEPVSPVCGGNALGLRVACLFSRLCRRCLLLHFPFTHSPQDGRFPAFGRGEGNGRRVSGPRSVNAPAQGREKSEKISCLRKKIWNQFCHVTFRTPQGNRATKYFHPVFFISMHRNRTQCRRTGQIPFGAMSTFL